MTVSAPLGGVGGSRMVMPRAVRSVVARAEPRVTERVCWPPSSVLAKSDVARFIELTRGHTPSEGGHRLVEGQPTAGDQAGHPAGDPSAPHEDGGELLIVTHRPCQRMALSRERRERKPSISHRRGAPLVGLQRRVMRRRLKGPALEELSSSAQPHHRLEVPPACSRA